MTFNGLPLHPLVVHLTVVTLPVLVLLSLASLHPRWRDRLRLPTVVLAVFAAALVWFTVKTGESLRDHLVNVLHVPVAQYDAHVHAADRLKLITYAFALLALLRFWLHGRAGWIRWVLGALVVAGAVAIGYFVFRTGDTGARLVYNGI